MRKRSRYRPKGVLINPVGYVLEGFKPVKSHDNFLINLKIQNHDAMANLTKGKATRADIDTLINMVNVVEALYRMGFGEDYGDVVHKGLDAVHAVGKRGAESNHFILRAQEMADLNVVLELHDAQMDIITIRDMETAVKLIEKEFEQRKMKPILERKTA